MGLPLSGARPWRRARQGGSALIDQVLSSGSALLLMVLVAREASAATFGAVSVALIVHGFMVGCLRAVVGEIALIRCRREQSTNGEETSAGLCLALTAAIVASVGSVIVGAVLGGETGRFLLLVAVASPFVYVQDLLRYVAYGEGAIDRAVLLDGLWLGVQAVLSAWLLMSHEATPTQFVLAWVAGAMVSALVGCGLGRHVPRAGQVGSWFRNDRKRASAFLTDYVISTGLVQASFLLLAAFLPLGDFGRFRLATVAVSPLANILAGVRVLTLANLAARREQADGAVRTAVRLAGLFAAIAVCYATALAVVPESLGVAALGSIWRNARTVAVVVALGEVFRLSSFPAIDFLKVFAPPSALLRSRAATAVGVMTGSLVGGITAGPMGAAVGIAMAMTLASVIWWASVLVSQRDAPAPAPAASAGHQ